MINVKSEVLIHHIKEVCKNNIERIDRMSDSGISTDVDIGMAYVYRKIYNIIKDGEEND